MNLHFPHTSTPFLPPASEKWKRLTNSFCMPPVSTWMITTTKLTKDCISPVCRASWLAIVRGFAGMQILEGILSFFPVIPEKWNSYSFQINYQGRTLHMHVGKEINISLIAGEELNIQVYKNVYKLKLGTDLLLRIEE